MHSLNFPLLLKKKLKQGINGRSSIWCFVSGYSRLEIEVYLILHQQPSLDIRSSPSEKDYCERVQASLNCFAAVEYRWKSRYPCTCCSRLPVLHSPPISRGSLIYVIKHHVKIFAIIHLTSLWWFIMFMQGLVYFQLMRTLCSVSTWMSISMSLILEIVQVFQLTALATV